MQMGVNMNREFAEKIIEAKKMEKEALLELLDPEISQHLQVIENEVSALVREIMKKGMESIVASVISAAENSTKTETKREEKRSEETGQKVRKVTIL